jgi:hypothetical protein
MRVVKAETKGGPHDDILLYRCIGDFGISVFHRPGWCYRPEASSLNRVRDDSIPPVERVIEQAYLIEFVLSLWSEIQQREKEKHDSETCSGSGSCAFRSTRK